MILLPGFGDISHSHVKEFPGMVLNLHCRVFRAIFVISVMKGIDA